MGKISIKRNGVDRIFDLAYLKYDEMVSLNQRANGYTQLSDLLSRRENILTSGTLQNIPAGAANDKFYIFKFSPVGSGSEQVVFPASALVGYEPAVGDEMKASRPLYYGARQKTGDLMSSFFDKTALFFDDVPPSGEFSPTDPNLINYHQLFNDKPFYAESVYKGADALATREQYIVTYNTEALFETNTEFVGTFGASLGSISAGTNAVSANIAIHSWGMARYYHRGSDWGTGGYIFSGNQAWGGKPFGPKVDNQLIIPYPTNEVDYNAHMNSSRTWSTYESDAELFDDIDSFFVCTSIDGLLYVGLAACRFSGRFVTDIQVTFLPDWFWGRANLELDFDTEDIPDFDGTWYGPDTPTNSGGKGSWSLTQSSVVTTASPVDTAFRWMTPESDGVHLVMVNGVFLRGLMKLLWGYKDAQRQKFFSSVIKAHQIPKQLLPDVNSSNFVTWLGIADEPYYCVSDSATSNDGRIVQAIDADRRFDKDTTGVLATFSTTSPGKPLFPYTDSYLDFDPYTNVQLFLPFAGTITIPAYQCIGGKIEVAAHIYYVTGDICYSVTCTSDEHILKDDYGKPIENVYHIMGNCAVDIPLFGITTGQQQQASNAMNAIGGTITVAAGLATGNPVMVGGGLSAMANSALNFGNYGGGAINAGGIGGSTSIIGNKSIILKITRPQTAFDKEWLAQNGTLSQKQVKLDEVKGTGFLKCAIINEEHIANANHGESEEIKSLLLGGVYI